MVCVISTRKVHWNDIKFGTSYVSSKKFTSIFIWKKINTNYCRTFYSTFCVLVYVIFMYFLSRKKTNPFVHAIHGKNKTSWSFKFEMRSMKVIIFNWHVISKTLQWHYFVNFFELCFINIKSLFGWLVNSNIFYVYKDSFFHSSNYLDSCISFLISVQYRFLKTLLQIVYGSKSVSVFHLKKKIF